MYLAYIDWLLLLPLLNAFVTTWASLLDWLALGYFAVTFLDRGLITVVVFANPLVFFLL